MALQIIEPASSSSFAVVNQIRSTFRHTVMWPVNIVFRPDNPGDHGE
jgi:hypothetical protein